MSDFDEIAAEGEKPSTDLADVRALAMKQLELEGVVDAIEVQLKEAKANLMRVQLGDLPAALRAAGIQTFQLDNGMTVALEEDLKIAVPKERKPAIIKKMREWGYGGNVVNQLVVDLGKGNDNAAKALQAQAADMGVEAVINEDIASVTVKKALKQQIAAGKAVDLAFYGAYDFTRTTVK